jgi:hypothetical protein
VGAGAGDSADMTDVCYHIRIFWQGNNISAYVSESLKRLEGASPYPEAQRAKELVDDE